MMRVPIKANKQEMVVANNDLKFGTSTEYPRDDTPFSVENIDELTPVRKFYDGQSILITGGTGFMGKLLIEKLFRGCPGINCIFLLIRPKKEKNVLQRKEEIMEDVLFSTLKKEQPEFQNRLIAIEGDCSLTNLGISKNDRARLIREVSIVFHVAATVRFDEKIKTAAAINVRSLKDMIYLSKEMSKLKSFVHVSSAYANCLQNPIEEKFYDPPMDADKFIDLMDCMDEKFLDDITPQLLGLWPNTYVYTKSIAENIVKNHAGLMPIGIFRPGIVVPTYQEPIRGYTDNMYGPVGIVRGLSMGLIRSFHCDGSISFGIVPGDLATNALIVSAWDIANSRRSNEETLIYNYLSKDNPITYDELVDMSMKYNQLLPTNKAIWYISFRYTKYRPVHLFYTCLLHLLPAFIFDTIAFCIGKQPRLFQLYKKIYKTSNMLNFFTITKLDFANKRWIKLLSELTAEDRELFFCDIKDLDWDNYFQSYILGIRLYIIKDPIETLPQARIKYRRLYWIHQTLKLVMACFFFMFTWVVGSRLL